MRQRTWNLDPLIVNPFTVGWTMDVAPYDYESL